jgi:alkanesulfonate monooxygenase SsuD/methylene tetrahydromethanopterin reductase-like flavin-dependent oxidoreductase (luciferase family)
MEIGIGLPTTVQGVDRNAILEFATRAEERGFSSLGTIDRLVFHNFESLIALAAAAAVTERIRLATDVLLVPWRRNGALVAKQAATLDQISGGRLVLGVAPGGRADDYAASGVPEAERGRLMDAMLEEMIKAWAGDDIGPDPFAGERPRLLVGGSVDASFRRAAKYGDGWTQGGGTPDSLREGIERLRAVWSEEGREGKPYVMALCYFVLGENAREVADAALKDYYAWLGEDLANMIAQSAAVIPEMAQQYRDGFAEAGADELIFFSESTDPRQVDLLADAVLEVAAAR